ncbi:MAG TPA: hypothetical protein VFR03_21835 [Thermoanaerobaculia bacterium]|nr:hypothetical protein [Thermoanaerobaculia bacterium]
MICPKCGFEQPDSPECARCGIIVSRYKGPVFGGAAAPVSPPPAPPPPVAASAVGVVFGDPAPAVAGGGTLYDGPPDGPVIGGTVYQGPAPGSQPRPGSVTQKLPVGEALSQSFVIFSRNIIPFLILAAVAFSPIYLFGDYLTQRFQQTNPAAAVGVASLIGLATALLCIPLTTAMITYGVFQEMRGRDLSLGSCLGVGLSSLLPVLSVALLQILFVMGAVIVTIVPISFLVGIAVAGGGQAGRVCSLLLVPLLFLAFVPAIMLWLRFYVAVPAAVEERPGALSAMRRSAFLTEGQRWPILAIVLVLGFCNGAIQVGASRVPTAGPFLAPLASLVTTALVATTCAVIYYRLRSFHESIDVDQIASVFA